MPSAGTYFRFAWDVVFTSTNNEIMVTYDGGGAVVTLTAGTYRWLDHAIDSRDLCAHLVNRLAAAFGGSAWVATIGTDGLLYLDCNKAWSIDWAHVATTADPRIFGCTAAAWGAAGAPFTAPSPLQLGHIWQPGVRYLDDSGLRGRQVMSRSKDLSGGVDTWRWGQEQDQEIYVPVLEGRMIWAADATVESTFDLFRVACASCSDVEWTPNISSASTHDAYVIAEDRWLEEWPIQPMRSYPQHWDVRIPLRLA